MNLTDEPRTLYWGTRIGEVHVITKCDRVEGLLPATPQYVDDSDDSDNEGQDPPTRNAKIPIHQLCRKE